MRSTFVFPHTILTYSLAVTDVTVKQFLKGNWGVIPAAFPFIYTGLCFAVIKRDFYIRNQIDRVEEKLENKSKETDWWSEWTYIDMTKDTTTTTTDTAIQYQYYGMTFIGILIIIGMKLATDLMKREINRYEEQYEELEDEADKLNY